MLTYNIKIKFNNEEDKAKVLYLCELERKLFNVISPFLYAELKAGAKSFKRKIVFDKFYHQLRGIYPEAPAQLIIRAIMDIIACYRSIKSNKHNINKPIEKKRLSIRLDKRIYLWNKDGTLNLTVPNSPRVKCSLDYYEKFNELKNLYPIADPLLFEKDNTFWLAVTFKNPEPPVTGNIAIGIDLGIKRPVATSDGQIWKAPQFNKYIRRVRYLKRQLQSKGTKAAKRKLKRLRRKEHNLNKNFTHNLVNDVIAKTNANIYVLEDLTGLKTKRGTQKKKKPKSLNRMLSQACLTMFRDILTYKASSLGKKVITVNPAFTSQRDSRNLKDGKRMGCRYIGIDGKILDADINAANNILIKFKFPYSSSSNRLSLGQAIVNEPNIFKSSSEDSKESFDLVL